MDGLGFSSFRAEGVLQDGKRHGAYEFFDSADVLRVSGEYRNGKEHGCFTYYSGSGIVEKQIQWVDGSQLGHTVYEDGVQTKAVELFDNSEVSAERTFWPNGACRTETVYEDGSKSGMQREFMPSGQVLFEHQLLAGACTGRGTIYNPFTGNTIASGFYRKGAFHGEWTFYHRNGVIQRKGRFRLGKATGEWSVYDEDAKLVAHGRYRAGVPIGTWNVDHEYVTAEARLQDLDNVVGWMHGDVRFARNSLPAYKRHEPGSELVEQLMASQLEKFTQRADWIKKKGDYTFTHLLSEDPVDRRFRVEHATGKKPIEVSVTDIVGHSASKSILKPSPTGEIVAIAVDTVGGERYTISVIDANTGDATVIAENTGERSHWVSASHFAYRSYQDYSTLHIWNSKTGCTEILETPDTYRSIDIFETEGDWWIAGQSPESGKFKLRPLIEQDESIVVGDVPGHLRGEEFSGFIWDTTKCGDMLVLIESNGQTAIVDTRAKPGPKNINETDRSVTRLPSPKGTRTSKLMAMGDNLILERRFVDGRIEFNLIDPINRTRTSAGLPDEIVNVVEMEQDQREKIQWADKYEKLYWAYTFGLQESILGLTAANELVPVEDESGIVMESHVGKLHNLVAVSSDGTPIDVQLATPKTGEPPFPCVLAGYGSMGVEPPNEGFFTSLLEHGIAVASVNTRGGAPGDIEWRNSGGNSKNKLNTLLDLEAAVQTLHKTEFISSDQIGFYGSSAGGILGGFLINEHPDKIRAVAMVNPVLDMLGDASRDGIYQYFFEFGNYNNSPFRYETIRTWSAVDNISNVDFPAIFLQLSDNDTRVSALGSAEWIDKITKISENPDLIQAHVYENQGHPGSSHYYSWILEVSEIVAFFIRELTNDQSGV